MADLSESRISLQNSIVAKDVYEAPVDLSEAVQPYDVEPTAILDEDKPMLAAEEEKDPKVKASEIL